MTTLKQQYVQRFNHLVQVCIRMTCVAVLTFGAGLSATAQDGSPEDQSLEEILQAQYEELLKQIRASMPDISVETPREVEAKRSAVRRLLGQHQQFVMAMLGDRSVFGVDYVQFQYDTAPRLTGRVLRVGPNDEFRTIDEAITASQSGDTILLADGEHTISQNMYQRFRLHPINDMQFVGSAADRCTLAGTRWIDAAMRVRFRGLTLDGKDNESLDLRSESAIQLVDCVVTNYNSGAGGSIGIASSRSTTWLLLRTTFQGGPGRAAGRGRGGNAFRLDGSAMTYVRQCQFIDNEEISRSSGDIETYDGCVELNSLPNASSVSTHSSTIASTRDNQVPIRGRTNEFVWATDDRPIIDAALGKAVELDEFSRSVVDSMRLDRRPIYWIGLLRHPDATVRRDAAMKIRTLLAPPGVELPEQPDDVNDLDNLKTALEAERQYSDLVGWYESVKTELIWNETAGRWVMRTAPPSRDAAGDDRDESQ